MATKKAQVKKDPSEIGGKRIVAARKSIDRTKSHSLADAIKALKAAPKTKFDETVDVAIVLGIDAKASEQNVRGVVPMPNGTGKTLRVAVFARDAKAEEAKKAGADIVGAEDLVEQINKGTINFDRCIATPDMMAMVGKVAKVLGPKGLMPNPKLGTVTPDVAKAVKATKAGQVEFRNDKGGIIHAGVGKLSFSEKAIAENVKAFTEALNGVKPANFKGIYFKKIVLSTTMGPGVKVDPATV
ncbi:MAG: 50S ribosomal protein L1 [Proteobacteria bacterium]|nr:50S ribosomal protein L1 [Pseudomonadota bacterium]